MGGTLKQTRNHASLTKGELDELLQNEQQPRAYDSNGRKQRSHHSHEPSIALGALIALCTYILPTSTLHTLIIRTDYTVTSLDHGNNSSANAF